MIYRKPLIIAILLTAFTAINVKAQITQTTKPVRELSPGEYSSDKRLEDYEGKWIAKNDSTFFKVILSIKRKVPYKSGNGFIYFDLLEGQYLFVKNGDTIVNTFSPPTLHLFAAPLVSADSELPLKFTFTDVKKKRAGIVTLTKDNDDILKWELTEPKHQFTLQTYGLGFSVPQNLTLTRTK